MLNVTNITPPRVPFIDERTNTISREWYRFFLSLFTLTGGGSSAATLEDLQMTPPAVDYSGEFGNLENQFGTTPPPIDYSADIAKLVNQQDLQPPPVDYTAAINQLRAELEIGTQPPNTPNTTPPENYLNPLVTITPTGSPFTYINETGATADVIVSGGGISKLEFSRNGATFLSTGSFYGMFTLSPYDRLRVTYVAAPSMTLVPR